MVSFWGTLRVRLRVLGRHPALVLYLGKGETLVGTKHIEIELRKARSLYDECARQGMDERAMVERFFAEICHGNAYLYALVRMTKSTTVVETGVRRGESSAFILQAFKDGNLRGHLYSIDLPNVVLPGGGSDNILPESAKTGFLVRPDLRGSWSLIFGDARVELPKLFSSVPMADLFHHDSDHSYSHMTFELDEAWPRSRVVACDDVDDNSAFDDFCVKVGVAPIKVRGSGIVEKTT